MWQLVVAFLSLSTALGASDIITGPEFQNLASEAACHELYFTKVLPRSVEALTKATTGHVTYSVDYTFDHKCIEQEKDPA